MKIHEQTTRAELAALICEALAAQGIFAVLTGGAVVSIYSDNEFESDDLDFIATADLKRIEPIMRHLGFVRSKGKYFSHPDTVLIVEFPKPPLMLGARYIPATEVGSLQNAAGLLRILTPTQCVMDRLASFYHWDDYQSLLQALAVARKQPVDLDQLSQWSTDEQAEEKYKKFLALLAVHEST